ncbi:MAG: EscU/YscU/HrcU family type III secretion system export apparatus switch protein [Deltaproteobacteria bacterium]|nr:EscU/YscU/HrcU family type III secretion system export apparatus switch protein [Deltaproteobacteria bacterium]
MDNWKKKIKRAVSLRYESDKDRAPKVTAKGQGVIADKIIALAKENNIPIHEDPDLVEILSKLDLEEDIPPTVYVLVAEILAFVYRMNERWPGQAAEKS